MGEFAITGLDAERLHRGIAELSLSDPERAARVRARAAAHGNGGEDEPCPVLDPDTGMCDLYAWRPVTCRVFGPAVFLDGGGVGACELCFKGASDEEIAACAVRFDADGLEAKLIEAKGLHAETTIADAIRHNTPEHDNPAPSVLGDAGRPARGRRPE
jgi:Fe-S-cluster containining protein